MAIPEKLRVMISSRCQDSIQFAGKPARLSDARIKLKQALENEQLLSRPIFDIWINEDAPPAAGAEDSWEHCMRQVDTADLVVVLYNGNSGWARDGGELGICHGELETVLSRSPAKVQLIELPLAPVRSGEAGARDKRFRTYVERQNLFRGQIANTGEDLITRCRSTLREAVTSMVKLGVREARKGKGYAGDSLGWRRLSFLDRRHAIESILRSALLARSGATQHEGQIIVRIREQPVLVLCHGIPDSLSVAAAREMIGQPFLKDHTLAHSAKDAGAGPVHLIGCNESISKSQARNILGFPDAMFVDTPFGIYVASDVQKIQLIFIRGCSDESATRVGVQRFFEWLEQSEEAPRLNARAIGRARIVNVVAEVNQEAGLSDEAIVSDNVVTLQRRKPTQKTSERHRKSKPAAG